MEDKQKLILWIHGFAGKPDNDSVQEMRRHYPAYDFYYSPKLVVNPVVDPVRDLRQFLGENTYKPGRPDGQATFLFTEEMLQEYATLEVQSLSPAPFATTRRTTTYWARPSRRTKPECSPSGRK